MKSLKLLCLFALAAAAAPVLAPKTHADETDTACEQDVAKLCPGAHKKGTVKGCLSENLAKLSDGCRKSFQASLDASENMMTVCAPELRTICPGDGHHTRCLAAHAKELSEACRKAVVEKRSSRRSAYGNRPKKSP